MALLTANQIVQIRTEWARDLSRDEIPSGLTKADADAFLAALDAYLDTNAAAINAELPEPARSILSKALKADGMARVARARYAEDV